jgi:hypothetical protein
MARARLATGEKPLWWVGSAKDDLLRFPEAVKDKVGTQCRTIWQEAPLRKAVEGRGAKRFGSCRRPSRRYLSGSVHSAF